MNKLAIAAIAGLGCLFVIGIAAVVLVVLLYLPAWTEPLRIHPRPQPGPLRPQRLRPLVRSGRRQLWTPDRGRGVGSLSARRVAGPGPILLRRPADMPRFGP